MQLARGAFRQPLMSGPTSTGARRSTSSHVRRPFDPSTARSNVLALPRLPVPDLRATMDRYLRSLEPFLLEDAARNGVPFDVAQARHADLADSFVRGWGHKCQARLLELDKKSPNNWLDDNIWLNKAYLEWRSPLVVNSNWWLALQNDNLIPADVAQNTGADGINAWQVRRAAWMLHRILDFKMRLESQEIYPESTRTGLWFRNAALKIFSSCRAPSPERDKMLSIPLHTPDEPHRILLMVHDWYYAIDVYASGSTGPSEPLGAAELERRIRAAVEDARSRLEKGERAPPVGVMSADDRGRWAENLDYLKRLSPSNSTTAQAIQNCILAVSLDDWVYPHTSSTSPSPAPPGGVTELDAHLHNTRSSHGARNRWFDKPFTLIVEANARVGVMGEHAPVDALVPSVVAEYAVVEGVDASAFADTTPPPLSAVADAAGAQTGWTRLDWKVDAHIEKECVAAAERVEKIIADSDDSVLGFDEYGADWMKNVARLAPDAYVQMALQLAWYKNQKCFTATYETALTRLFRNGRTETIRTLTSASRAWVLAMVDPSATATTRLQRLQIAVQNHASLTREAATGKGIDRHLLGLQCMPEAALADFYQNEAYTRSQRWRLSTSGLSAGHLFRGTGFGAPLHDGYGVNYLAGPDIIKFGIESKHSCPSTSTAAFKSDLSNALREMKLLVEAGISDASDSVQPQARL